MTLPTIDAFLAYLNRMRRDCSRLRDAALADGDGRAARTFEQQAAQIERMIWKTGGTIDA